MDPNILMDRWVKEEKEKERWYRGGWKESSDM